MGTPIDPPHLGGFIPCDEHSYTPWLWDYLIEEFSPKSMLDVGCGEGRAAKYFLDSGVDAYGIDGSVVAQRTTVLPPNRFILHDFATALLHPKHVDLIWCCEFVEHVEEKYLDRFLLDVFAFSKVVAMTFAWPGQPGHHHVNCQEQSYWVSKLASIYFKLDEARTARSRAFPPDVLKQAYWGRTGLIFTREKLECPTG